MTNKQKLARLKTTKVLLVIMVFMTMINTVMALPMAQWPNTTSPVPVRLMLDAYESYGTPTSDGYYIIAFTETGVNAQKIDDDGTKLWNSGNPVVVNASATALYEVVGDNNGGAFVAYMDSSTPINQLVSKINSDGTIAWTAGDFDVDPVKEESWPRIIHDGSGGVFVIWASKPNIVGTYLTLNLTHLDSSGNVDAAWNTAGSGTYRPVELPKPAGATTHDREPRLILSDSNSIIVAWINMWPASDNLFITKYQSDGTYAWGGPGYIVINDVAPIRLTFQAEPDGSDGVFIGYYASPNIKIAKINSAGTFDIGSAAGGLQYKALNITFDEPDQFNSSSDDNGNLYLAWSEDPTAASLSEIFVQKFNSSGTAQWAAGGVQVTTTDDGENDFLEWIYTYNLPHTLVHDGTGGVVLAMNRMSATIPSAVAVQRVTSSGTVDWGTGVIVTEDTANDYEE